MATSQNTTTASRFHNLSDAALADEIGRIDAISKAAEAELKTLKDEFKARGLSEVAGDSFAVTATEQIAGRLDTKAVREFRSRYLPARLGAFVGPRAGSSWARPARGS
jgi:hypothetical protein